MDNIERLDDYVFDKPTNMDVDGEGQDYMDEDPRVLMLKDEGTQWELAAITKTTTKLKNWEWKGAAHPMEEPLEKTQTTKPFTPTKSIISISIESFSANIATPVKSICDHVSIPVESITVVFVKNSTCNKIISNFAYLLVLNIFIIEICKETLNGEELK